MREHDGEHAVGTGRVSRMLGSPLAPAIGVDVNLPKDLIPFDLDATEIMLSIRVVIFRKRRIGGNGMKDCRLRFAGQGIDPAGFDDHSRKIAGSHSAAEQVVQDRDVLGGCDRGAHCAPPLGSFAGGGDLPR